MFEYPKKKKKKNYTLDHWVSSIYKIVKDKDILTRYRGIESKVCYRYDLQVIFQIINLIFISINHLLEGHKIIQSYHPILSIYKKKKKKEFLTTDKLIFTRMFKIYNKVTIMWSRFM